MWLAQEACPQLPKISNGKPFFRYQTRCDVELRPGDFLDISTRDAERLCLRDGDCARVRSRYGSVALPVKISDGIRSGELFATFHTPEVFMNLVTSSERDGITDTSEYKRTAVQVEKLS